MQLPLASSVSITRPDELAKELFTHTGSGTLVRRGERVLCMRALGRARPRRACAQLIESGFGRKLVAGLFRAARSCWRVYVSENYRAALILTAARTASPYLDKFAVPTTRRARASAAPPGR